MEARCQHCRTSKRKILTANLHPLRYDFARDCHTDNRLVEGRGFRRAAAASITTGL